jgi:ketosteroid isomerase-like protein
MTLTNAELARRGWEAALRGDFEVVAEILDPAVRWHGGDPHSPGSCQNRDQALAFMARGRADRPLPELVELREAGDKVVMILRRKVSDHGQSELVANLTSFRRGKVVEMVHYEDPGEALAAAGLSG